MPPGRALYYSVHISERIPRRASPTLADTYLVSYPSSKSPESYRCTTRTSLIPFDSPLRAHSSGPIPDSSGPLPVELPQFVKRHPRHLRSGIIATSGQIHTTASNPLAFSSAKRVDSSGSISDSIRPLVVELPSFETRAAWAAPFSI